MDELQRKVSRRAAILSITAAVGALIVTPFGQTASVLGGERPSHSSEPNDSLEFVLEVQNRIDLAIAYLEDKFDQELGLLREAATDGVRSRWYWLFNDNALAARVLNTVGKNELAAKILTTLVAYDSDPAAQAKGYSSAGNAVLEVLWGGRIEWPPFAPTPMADTMVRATPDGREIRYEGCRTSRYLDWAEYTNLTMFGVLDQWRTGNRGVATRLFHDAFTVWDGIGFQDRSFRFSEHNEYETFKVALALYVGVLLRLLTPERARELAQRLLSQQQVVETESQQYGGFYTHYDSAPNASTNPDTNTETTCFALLALHTYLNGPSLVRPAAYLPNVANGYAASGTRVPLAAVFAPWYGYRPDTGDLSGGIGTTHWLGDVEALNTPERGFYPYASTPSAGDPQLRQPFYCSASPDVIRWQLDWLDWIGVQALFVSWWGWGDTNLDGTVEGHPDAFMNKGVVALLEEVRARGGHPKVALIAEPFSRTQANVEPLALTDAQRRAVLNWLWDHYYQPYADCMFRWDGNPLLMAFDPLRLPADNRYTLRHWTGRERSSQTVGEGWQWFFAPPQGVLEGMSDDGVAFVYPRFDERYLFASWGNMEAVPRSFNPDLGADFYAAQWGRLAERRQQVKMVVLYSWNLYGELAHVEPAWANDAASHHPTPPRFNYVELTRRFYNAFLAGSRIPASALDGSKASRGR